MVVTAWWSDSCSVESNGPVEGLGPPLGWWCPKSPNRDYIQSGSGGTSPRAGSFTMEWCCPLKDRIFLQSLVVVAADCSAGAIEFMMAPSGWVVLLLHRRELPQLSHWCEAKETPILPEGLPLLSLSHLTPSCSLRGGCALGSCCKRPMILSKNYVEESRIQSLVTPRSSTLLL